jgi:hypothetical protein
MPTKDTVSQPAQPTVASFQGGLNAVSTPHTLQQNEVQASTNIDFSLEYGGASPRQGNFTYAWTAAQGTSTIRAATIGRNYANNPGGIWVDPVIPWFMCGTNGVTYTGTGSFTSTTSPPIVLASVAGYSGGTTGGLFPQITHYQSYIYVANGSSAFKTNGTNTFDWLMPQADTPTVTFAQQGTFTGTGAQAGAFVAFAGTTTASEGTVTASSTSTYFGNSGGVIISTCTTGTGTRIVVIGTCTTTNWENTVDFITPPTGNTVTLGAGTYTIGGGIDFHQGYPNGDTTGTYTASATITQTLSIGQYGTDYILLGLPDQQSIVTVQRDLSIGDTTFTNYWHNETTPAQIADATTDPLSLLLSAQGTAIFSRQTNALNVSRVIAPNVGRRLGPSIPTQRRTISKAATTVSISPWATARSDYQFIGTLPTPDFTNIHAVRVTVEFSVPNKQILVGGVVTYGAEGWCLNDQAIGISYFQTFARVENGVIVAEGAPSQPSPPTKAQYAYGILQCATATNTTAGITHRVFYRTGGLLQDAYQVGSCTITSANALIYDYNLPDLLIVENPSLTRNLWSVWPDPSGNQPYGANVVSEPWQERIWVGVGNQLYWSAPGVPSKIQNDTLTIVGDDSDVIMGLVPWNNLIIVSQASVYEMSGTIFEGTNANWSIQKSGARRGSAAPNTVIKTPYGVLLFNADGISLYQAGMGVDRELDWAYKKIADLWRGSQPFNPAAFKGRIPGINLTAIFNSCAAVKDNKIYLAVPTGQNLHADTTFILDVVNETVQMFVYPFNICSLFYDKVLNRMMAGTDLGTIQELEEGYIDGTPVGGTQGISWSFKTRAWTTPDDMILENLQVESVGTWTASAIVDNSNTYTLTTGALSAKDWLPASLQGTIGDNVVFQFSGTQNGSPQEIYQMAWDNIPQTSKIKFFETDVIDVPSENYLKTWLVEVDCIGTATVTATILVNGTAVTLPSGGTSVGLVNTTAGKKWFEIGLPNVTTAKQVQAVYNSTTTFKYYDTSFEFEPKPFEKLTWLVTYKRLGGVTQVDMGRFYAMDIEGTLTATVTATWIIDGLAFTTNTFTLSAANAGEPTGLGRMYADQVPFPPGARGYLFQQQLTSSQPFRVWKAHLDIDRIGVKGFSRMTLAGTPTGQD